MPEFKLPKRYVARAVFSDPTPNGLINRRFVQSMAELSEHTKLTDEDKTRLFRVLMMVANKLGAVWYHKQRYTEAEAELLAKARQNAILRAQAQVHIEYAPVLFYECDSFLVQVKSCLDHLVKVPHVCLGAWWNLTTFGSHGEDAVNLARNAPAEYRVSCEGFVKLIEDHASWLKDIINARDRINHLQEGGISPESFAVFVRQDEDGKLREQVPMWAGEQSLSWLMNAVWGGLLRFTETFFGLTLAARVQDGSSFASVPIPPDVLASPWRVISRKEMLEAVSKPGWTKAVPSVRKPRTPGRNDPCHCGSGEKYKKCCLRKDQAAARARRAPGV